MTDPATIAIPAPLAPGRSVGNVREFRIANRHSRHVKVLRRLLIAGVVTVVGGIAVVTIFDPFHAGPAGASIDGVALDGAKVTMANPKLSGYHADGRPYEISASSAVQDIRSPTVFELHDLKARLTMSDKSVTSVTADLGSYNSTDEIMNLTSAVHIVSDAGLDMRTQNAHVEFKTSSVATDRPVTVKMRGSTIDADSMRVVDGGKQVTFDGHVHSIMVPDQQVAASDVVQAGVEP